MRVLLVLPVKANLLPGPGSSMVHAEQQLHSLISNGVNVEPLYVTNRKSIKGLWQYGILLRKKSQDSSINIVHVMWGTSLAFMSVFFSKKPVVVSFCGSDLLGVRDSNGAMTLGGRINQLLSRIASLFANANITKSAEMKKYLWSSARKKTTIIPNGIDGSLFRPIPKDVARNKININHNRPIVLFFYTEGQVVKNPQLAYDAFDQVKQQIPDAELLVARGIPHQLLPYYYNSCDVMLLTSFHEGSNNSLKEAIFCNLPVVSVNVGDAQERLQHINNSFVINSWDAPQLAEKTIQIIQSQSRSNGSSISDDIKKENIAKKIELIYQDILK